MASTTNDNEDNSEHDSMYLLETLHVPIAPSNLPISFYSNNARGESRIIIRRNPRNPLK